MKPSLPSVALPVIAAAQILLMPEANAQTVITSVKRLGSNVEVKFKGATGSSYRLQRSPAMAAGSWTNAGPAVEASGAEQTITVAAAAVNGREFFQLVLIPANIPGYAYIPGGAFRMGDQSNPADGIANERPIIEVPAGGFHLKTTEVTKAEWDTGKTFATGAGYTFSTNAGLGKAASHPVHSVNWYDIVKWCNARSEQDGLEPCYYNQDASVYRTGSPSTVVWNFTKNGYRLPCEAEWEKAARGGLEANRFPWGAIVTHAVANYKSTTLFTYDGGAGAGFHPSYSMPAVVPYTSPAGSFAANAFGLHDMSGNVREYCWDSLTTNYSNGYAVRTESSNSITQRVARGGDWSSEATTLRCSQRGSYFPETGKGNYLGFRTARGRLN